MKVSRKGLYALAAMTMLARNYPGRIAKVHEIALAERIPEKFLELILLDLKKAGMIESRRGAQGGYRLKRSPSKIPLGEIIRTVDGPLAPFADGISP